MSKLVTTAMPQAQADKLIARVEQPLAKHYNGQGVARPSEYLPLSEEHFQPVFEALWQAHVEFGTSRSHKKLLGQKRRREEPALAAGGEAGDVDADAALPAKKKGARRRQQSDDANDGAEGVAQPAEARVVQAAQQPRKPPPTDAVSSGSAAAPAQLLANKGRFAGTLAARLLGGGAS